MAVDSDLKSDDSVSEEEALERGRKGAIEAAAQVVGKDAEEVVEILEHLHDHKDDSESGTPAASESAVAPASESAAPAVPESEVAAPVATSEVATA